MLLLHFVSSLDVFFKNVLPLAPPTDFLHHDLDLLERCVDAVPVDDAGPHDVVELEDDETVLQVRVDAVHVGRHAHAVHPVPVRCKVKVRTELG